MLPIRLDLHLLRPSCRGSDDGDPLGGDRFGHEVAVADGVDVWAHVTGDDRVTEPEAGLHDGELPVGRDRVGREQDAGRLWEDHLLHDHGHAGPAVVDAVVQPVGHSTLGEQGGPAPADVCENGRRTHDVQVCVLLAGEGDRWGVLCGRTGSDSACRVLAEPGDGLRDRGRQLARYLDRFDDSADVGTDRPDRFPVGRAEERKMVQLCVEQRRLRHHLLEGIRGYTETGRDADAIDTARQLTEACPLTADERDLRLVDIPEIHDAVVHPSTFPSLCPVLLVSDRPPAPLRVPVRTAACIVSRRMLLAASPPPACTMLLAGAERIPVRSFGDRSGVLVPLRELRNAAPASGRAGPRGVRRSRWPTPATPSDRRPAGRAGCHRGERARTARGRCGIQVCRGPAGCLRALSGRAEPEGARHRATSRAVGAPPC